MDRGDSSSRARPFRGSRRGRGRGDMNKKFKYNSRYDYDDKNAYDYDNYYNYNHDEGYDYGYNEYSKQYPDVYGSKYNTSINNEVENNGDLNTGIPKKFNSTIQSNFSLGKYNISKTVSDKNDSHPSHYHRNNNFHPIKSPTSRSVSGSPLNETVELNKPTINNYSESKINITTHILPKGPASVIESKKKPSKIIPPLESTSKNTIESFSIQQNKLSEPIIDKLPRQTDFDNQSQKVLLEKQKFNKSNVTDKNMDQSLHNSDTISLANSRSSSPNKLELSVASPNNSNSNLSIPVASLPKGPMGKIDSSKQILNVSIPDEQMSPNKNQSTTSITKTNNNSLKRSHSTYIPSYPGDGKHKRRAIGTPPIDDVAPTSVINSSSLMKKEKPISNNYNRKNDVRTYTMQNIRENETVYIDYKPDDDNSVDNIDGIHTAIRSSNENKEFKFRNNKDSPEHDSVNEINADVSQLEEISFHPSRSLINNNNSDSVTQNTKKHETDNSKIEETISFKNYNQQKVNDSSICSPDKIVKDSQFVNGIVSLVKPHIEEANEEEINNEKITNDDGNQTKNDSNNEDVIEIRKEVVINTNDKRIEIKGGKEMNRETETEKELQNKIENKNLVDIKSNVSPKEDDKNQTNEAFNELKLPDHDIVIENNNKNKEILPSKKDSAESRVEDNDALDIANENETEEGIKNEPSDVADGKDLNPDIKKHSDSVSAKTEEPNNDEAKNEMKIEKGNPNYYDNNQSDNIFTAADNTIDYTSSIGQLRVSKREHNDNQKKSGRHHDFEKTDKTNNSDSFDHFSGSNDDVTDSNGGRANVNGGKLDTYSNSKFLRKPHFDISREGLDINLPSEILNLFKNSRYERIPSFRTKNSVIQNFSQFRMDRLLFSTKNLNIYLFDHTMVSTFMPNPEMYSYETYCELISRENTHFNWYDHVLPELESAQRYNSGIGECYAKSFFSSRLREIEEDLNAKDKTSMEYLSKKLFYRWSETLLTLVKTNVSGMLAKNVLVIDRKCDPKKIYADVSTLSKHGFTFHFVLFSNFFNFPNQGDSLIMTLLDEIYNRRFPWADAAKEITIFKPKSSAQHTNISIKSDVIDVNIIYTAKRFSYVPLPALEVKKVYENFSKASLFKRGKYVGKLTLAVAGTAFRLSHDSILSLNVYLHDIGMLPEKSKYRQFEFNFRDIFLSLGKVTAGMKKELDRNVTYDGSILKYGKIENSIYAVQFLISADNDLWLYGSPVLIVAKNRRLTFSESKSLLHQIDWCLSDSEIPFKFKFFESTKIKFT